MWMINQLSQLYVRPVFIVLTESWITFQVVWWAKRSCRFFKEINSWWWSSTKRKIWTHKIILRVRVKRHSWTLLPHEPQICRGWSSAWGTCDEAQGHQEWKEVVLMNPFPFIFSKSQVQLFWWIFFVVSQFSFCTHIHHRFTIGFAICVM